MPGSMQEDKKQQVASSFLKLKEQQSQQQFQAPQQSPNPVPILPSTGSSPQGSKLRRFGAASLGVAQKGLGLGKIMLGGVFGFLYGSASRTVQAAKHPAVKITAFVVLAAFIHYARYKYSNGTWGSNGITLFLDILMLIIAGYMFAPESVTSILWGIVGTIAAISYSTTYLLPYLDFLPNTQYILPIFILIFWFVIARRSPDPELHKIMFFFMLQIGAPLANLLLKTPAMSWIVDILSPNTGWTILVLMMPYWAIYGIAHQVEGSAFLAILNGVAVLILALFPLMFLNLFEISALQSFTADAGLSPEQKEAWDQGWANFKVNFDKGIDRLKCLSSVMVRIDTTCLDKLNEKEQAQIILPKLDITFPPYEHQQTFVTNQDSFVYSQNVKIKNEGTADMKVQFLCGLVRNANEVNPGDLYDNVASLSEVTIPKGETLERTVQCSYPERPSLERPMSMLRVFVRDLTVESRLYRYFVEKKDATRTQSYQQLLNTQFPNNDISTKAELGFSHMIFSLDRPGGLVEMPRLTDDGKPEEAAITSKIINNGKGQIILKQAEFTLDPAFTVRTCMDNNKNIISTDNNRIRINPTHIPVDFIKQGESQLLTTCWFSYAPKQTTTNADGEVAKVLPTLYEFKGKIIYDYQISSFAQMSIRNPRPNEQTSGATS